MDKKGLAQKAVEALKQEYPDALCSLEYTDPLQLLIATRLADAVGVRDHSGLVEHIP